MDDDDDDDDDDEKAFLNKPAMNQGVFSLSTPAGIHLATKPWPINITINSSNSSRNVHVDCIGNDNHDLQVNENEVLIRVVCAGLNPVDAKYVVGDKLPSVLNGLVRQFVVNNTVVGFDFAGIVLKIGDSSSSSSSSSSSIGNIVNINNSNNSNSNEEFVVGDHVFGIVDAFHGTVSDVIVAKKTQIAKMSKKLSFAEAACLPLVGITALQALTVDYPMKPSQQLLVIGATGGVGHIAVQIGKSLGLGITAVCSGRNADLVKKLGADEIVDYTTPGTIAEKLQSIVARNGKFHVVLDTVTSHDHRDTSIVDYQTEILSYQNHTPLIVDGGVYITIGGYTMEWAIAGLKRTIGWNLFGAYHYNHTIRKELFWVRFPNSAPLLKKLSQLADDDKVRPIISNVYDCNNDDLAAAFNAIRSRRVIGKIAIQMLKL